MLCTLLTMLFIYVVTGVTYELPRLWIAFLPPLTLAALAGWPVLRGNGDASHPRVAKLFAVIVGVQILFTALHWTLLDVRESEYRLASKRFYN